MFCRKNQLLQSIKSKEKVLAKHQERPDPREGAPAIKAEIQTLHNKMTDKVLLLGCFLYLQLAPSRIMS